MNCSSDMLLQQAECVSLHSGLLLGSVCFGLLLGMIAAVLIHTLLFKPYCLSAKSKGDPWSLMDVDEENDEMDQDVMGKKTEPAQTVSHTDSPVINDVSAFALKARVVYPINQRYRPLADGASDPSHHDSTSSSSDWPDESGDEIQSISSSPAQNTHTNFTFRRAQHYAQTLSYPEDEQRLSLLCVTLQSLHQHMAQLQKERWEIFLQIVRALFSTDSQLIEYQEKELEKLKRELSSGILQFKMGAEPMCSIEELETSGRVKLEHTLHMALSFAKQLDRLCQHFYNNNPNNGTQDVIRELIRCLLMVDRQLKVIHTNIIQTLWDRQQWWEELSGWLSIRTAVMRQEVELIIQLTSQSVEELTADRQLEFDCMEKLISELQSVMSRELQNCIEQLRDHTLQMVSEHSRKISVKLKKMIKTQIRESHTIPSHQDAQEIAQLMANLKLKHWTQRQEFELQQDRRVSDAVCELWKKIFSNFSEHVRKLWRECVVSMLTTSSSLSEEQSCTLLNNLELSWTNQMQQKENHTPWKLQMLREQLEQSKQIWVEQAALSTAALNHLGNQNMKITRAVFNRQKDIKESFAVIEGKQRLLLSDLQHHLTTQHFYNTALRGMLTTQLSHTDSQSLQQELLSDLETTSELLRSHAQFVIGHALTQSVQLGLVNSVPSDTPVTDNERKEQLKKALCDSVYVSRDSLSTLIMNYCSHLQTVIMAMQLHPPQHHSQLKERWQKTAECVRSLQRELSYWARKPNSAEFYRRVEQQKRRFLCHSEEESACDQIDLQHQTQAVSQELQKEEESFLSRLAALTRVPVRDTPK